MCGPLAAPLMIASTVLTAGASIMGGIAANQQAGYAANIAEQNRRIANNQADDAANNTALEAQRRYRQIGQTKGAQQAALAANGVDINFGTSLDLQRDTAMIGAEDVGQIYKAGNENVIGFDREAWNYGAEASAQRAKGKGALVHGFLGAAATALGGASQLSKMKAPIGSGFSSAGSHSFAH